MKRLLTAALFLSLALSVTACGQDISREDYKKVVSENENLKAENKALTSENEKAVEEQNSLAAELNSAKQKIASLEDELAKVKSESDENNKAEEESSSPESRSFTFGEELTVTADGSTFKITIDDIKKRDAWDGSSEKSNINILCVIENRNYQSWTYDGAPQSLVPYTLFSDGIMKVEDENGFSLQFADVTPYQDGMYNQTDVPFDTKARICIPVEAEKSCSGITLRVGNYTTEVSFND